MGHGSKAPIEHIWSGSYLRNLVRRAPSAKVVSGAQTGPSGRELMTRILSGGHTDAVTVRHASQATTDLGLPMLGFEFGKCLVDRSCSAVKVVVADVLGDPRQHRVNESKAHFSWPVCDP
jgi:hypothetical protein